MLTCADVCSALARTGEHARDEKRLFERQLQMGDALFWETFLGMQVDARLAPHAAAEAAAGGDRAAGAAEGTPPLSTYEQILDRYLYMKLPAPAAEASSHTSLSPEQPHTLPDAAGPPPLVLVGPSGSGKTALLRMWCAQAAARTEPQATTVLSYFGTDSALLQPATALAHVMSEIKTRKLLSASDHVRMNTKDFATHVAARSGSAGEAWGGEGGGGVLHGRYFGVC